jgi:16S rRNA (guanine966-N2)-methyltransferase
MRPTSDKIKAVIFSMLEAEALKRGFETEEGDEETEGRFAAAVAWPRVLELYAGSGALAIEALSRGAQHADLVESSRDARQAITANLTKTGLAERASVHSLTSERAVSTFRGPYDLILLDPPYDAEGVRAVIDQLAAGRLLERSGIVVWEHRRSVTPPERIDGPDGEPRLQLMRTRSHGTSSVTLSTTAAEN